MRLVWRPEEENRVTDGVPKQSSAQAEAKGCYAGQMYDSEGHTTANDVLFGATWWDKVWYRDKVGLDGMEE